MLRCDSEKQLPGEWLTHVEVAAARAVGGESGERGAGFAAFAQLHRCAFASHVGLDPAGVGGVDLDVGVAQLIRQVNGKGVERGFGGVVGEGLGVVDRRFRIGVQTERTEDAGQIYDAAGGAFLDQRKKLFGEGHLGEEVCLEYFVQDASKGTVSSTGAISYDLSKAVAA